VQRVESALAVPVTEFDYDLVNTSEIAKRIGRTRQAATQYIEGSRGPGGFPQPMGAVGDGQRIWDWGSVVAWLARSGLPHDPEYHPPRQVLVVFNTWLAQRSNNPAAPTA
jgi:hypothetical protein